MRVYETKEVPCPCKPGCFVSKRIERKICDVCGSKSVGVSLELYADTWFDACQPCAINHWVEVKKEIQRKYRIEAPMRIQK